MTRTREPGALPAGILSLLVHGIFFGALVVGVSWQHLPTQPVMVELWDSLPEPPPPPPPPPQQAPLRTEPKPLPPPPKPETVEPRPDIALEKKRKEAERKKARKREAEKKRKEEENRRQKALEEAEQERRKEAEKTKRQEDEKKRRLLAALREEEALRNRLAQEDEAKLRRLREISAREKVLGKLAADYKDQISAIIESNVRLPDNLQGNPQVQYRVHMLPTGEVRDLKMIRSSGNPLYDREVERAILKSRLPPPPDKALYESFRELTLSFRPRRED